MERLTHKVDGEYYPIQNILGSVRPRIHAKLGKLEDIEEELGIPLEVLFKALKEGIYCVRKEDDRRYIYFYERIKLVFYEGCWLLTVFDEDYDETFVRYFKGYGKTWSLDKKDLEGN